jgi:hypothetical protein
MSQDATEYGGSPGIIQPDIGDPRLPDEAAAAGLGHATEEGRAADRKGVRDAAMIVRRAGMAEAHGLVAETVIDPDTGVASFVNYDEDITRQRMADGEEL